jgi:Subtilase family
MTSRFFAIGALGMFIAITAVSEVGPVQPVLRRPATPGATFLRATGSRSLRQRESKTGSKFDASLAEISRHWNTANAGRSISSLHSLNPAARFLDLDNGAGPMVLIDAITTGDPQELKAALLELGLQHPAVFANDVGGWLPVAQLEAATQRSELHSIRASMSRTRSGAVTSQGDFAQHSDAVRSANSLTGAGVTVGVLSDSYNCYPKYASAGIPAGGNQGYAFNGFLATASTDVSTGDLPSAVAVLEEAPCLQYGAPAALPFGDEGRAIMQIVHDVAPGAALAFYTAVFSEADFAAGIEKLAAPVASGGAGAKVIIDDVGYFQEPFFQDGLVAQAIDAVAAQGAAYFTSAGNDGTLAYDNVAPSFATTSTSAPNATEKLLTIGTTGGTASVSLPVSIPSMSAGDFIAIIVQWDQPYVTGAPKSGGATSQIDLCVTDVKGNDVVDDDDLQPLNSCTGPNATGTDPVQVMLIDNPANNNFPNGNSAPATLNIQVGLVSGPAPGRIKIVVAGDGLPGLAITQFSSNGPTLQGHASAAGGAAVGAAFFANTVVCGAAAATLESFSSPGGDPILFDVNGTRLVTPVFRQKPDFVGPDGGNDTFLGFELADAGIADSSAVAGCKNNASFPNFFGTSASAPHVASIAALFLQANPTLTPLQIYQVMQQNALPMGATTPNNASGFGFVRADFSAAALTPVLPAAPALSLAATTLAIGASTTITWSSANTASCSASGSWSGTLASNGSQSITPAAVGTDTYTLTCKNFAGTSTPTSVTLTVDAVGSPASPSSSGGGGGAMGIATLLGLAGIFLARWRRLNVAARIRMYADRGIVT